MLWLFPRLCNENETIRSVEMKRRTFVKTVGAGAASLALSFRAITAAKSGKRPNILFFFPDQHRFDLTGLNPHLPLHTPNINMLAHRGVYFKNNVCPSPLCAPSRAAVASGREYDRCGVPDNFTNNYPVEQTTFYLLLRNAGYHVLGCGKFDMRKKAMSWGRDGKQVVDGVSYLGLWGFSDGIDNSGKWDGYNAYKNSNACPYYAYLEEKGLADAHIEDFTRRRGKNFENTDCTPLPDEAYADNWIARNGLELIRNAPPGKPWFLQVNFNGPHPPMDVTERMRERWRETWFPQPNECTRFTVEKHIEIRQNYSAMIENIDRWLGIYVKEIKKHGELENTLIVYSSDHGEMLGDHDRWSKVVPYQPSVGVPLVIAGPGVRRGWVCDAPVTTMDLAATFLDYGSVPVPESMDSRSMRTLLEGKSDHHRDFVRSGLGPWRLVFDGRYKLIRGFDETESNVDMKEPVKKEPTLLFDLKEDPLENVNVARKYPDIVKRLAGLLNGV